MTPEEPQLFGREIARDQLARLKFELANRQARVDGEAPDFHVTELEFRIIALQAQIDEDEDHDS